MDRGILSDGEIIELYFHRDETAIAETDAKYGRMLFRIAYNVTHDRLDAEECKNDTYLGAWERIPPEVPQVLSAFLIRIARNISIERYRAASSQKRVPSELTESVEELAAVLSAGNSTESEFASEQLGKLISDYVRSLPERQRYIFIARYYMSETVEYIASRLGVGKATVHRDTEKIKSGLAAHLERNGVNL